MTTKTQRDGYWVIKVDRKTGKATTSRLYRDADAAWQRALDLESPVLYTTVVGRREF